MVRVVGAFPKEGASEDEAVVVESIQPSIWGMSPLVSLKHHKMPSKYISKFLQVLNMTIRSCIEFDFSVVKKPKPLILLATLRYCWEHFVRKK
jgi:hypothetical protein